MSRLTADQARAIAQMNNPAAAVDSILAGIEEAAGKGGHIFITRQFGFGDGSYYTSEKNYPELGKAILRELRALGYSCDVRCSEGQFVDLWLEVKWEAKQ